MSAIVPGAGNTGGDPEALGQALLEARQEAATLRGVLTAIWDALTAAMARLEALEAQIPACNPARQADGELARPASGPGHGLARSVPGWKLPNWTPTTDDIVSGDTLRLRREALGISQAAVAHAAHCSRGLVAEVERGKRRSAQTLAHLASVLDKLEQQARRN